MYTSRNEVESLISLEGRVSVSVMELSGGGSVTNRANTSSEDTHGIHGVHGIPGIHGIPRNPGKLVA